MIDDTPLIIFTVAVYSLGIGMICIGIKLHLMYGNRKRYWKNIDGRVIRVVGERNFKGKIMYWPVYEYEVDGIICTKKANVGSNPSLYKQFDKINILVNPENINESDIFDWRYRVLPIGLILMGCGILCIKRFV